MWPRGLVADGNGNRGAGVDDFGPTDQTVGRGHGHRSHTVSAEVLGSLGPHGLLLTARLEVDLECEQDLRKTLRRELYVHNRTGHFGDASYAGCLSQGRLLL